MVGKSWTHLGLFWCKKLLTFGKRRLAVFTKNFAIYDSTTIQYVHNSYSFSLYHTNVEVQKKLFSKFKTFHYVKNSRRVFHVYNNHTFSLSPVLWIKRIFFTIDLTHDTGAMNFIILVGCFINMRFISSA